MKNVLLQTNPSAVGPLAARIMAAIVLFPHGAQKALGWFGGYGFSGTMDFFTNTVHLPYFIGLLVIIIEFVGPLFLLAGAATRVWAALMTVNMLGILFTAHISNGFFMNWFGNQAGEGFEYHLLFIGLLSTLVIAGGGLYSVDSKLQGLQFNRSKNHLPVSGIQ